MKLLFHQSFNRLVVSEMWKARFRESFLEELMPKPSLKVGFIKGKNSIGKRPVGSSN